MTGDAELAADLARDAGRLLQELRRRGDVSAADERSDRFIARGLRAARPDDAILSEEVASTGDRHTARRVWIVDPLDGTCEYRVDGRDDWAVHVALWEGGELAQGAVAVPDRAEVWSTGDAVAAPVGRPIRRVMLSRTRPPAWARAVVAEMGAEAVMLGSAGAKTAALLRGDADAYLHDGGQYEWDSAAPVVVARHYGWFASRADGSALEYNRRDPWLPDLVLCPPDAATDLIARIQCHRPSELTGDPL